MGQYFTNDDNVKSSPHEISVTLYDKKYTFISDNGVFSKNEIDDGSISLLKILFMQPLGGRILDVGCGYGTIGLILKHFFPTSEIEMVDVNRRALSLAQENARRMNLIVKIYESDILNNVDGEFDNIVTNPPIRAGKKVVYAIFAQAYAHLKKLGALYFVIRKDQGAPSAQKEVISLFGNCELLKRDKGYYIYRAIKSE